MSLTHLKLSLNEDFGKNSNYTAYNTTATECVNFFEGVYEYGCPGKPSIMFIVLHQHAIVKKLDNFLNAQRWRIVSRFCRMFRLWKWSEKCRGKYYLKWRNGLFIHHQISPFSTPYWTKYLHDKEWTIWSMDIGGSYIRNWTLVKGWLTLEYHTWSRVPTHWSITLEFLKCVSWEAPSILVPSDWTIRFVFSFLIFWANQIGSKVTVLLQKRIRA